MFFPFESKLLELRINSNITTETDPNYCNLAQAIIKN